MSTELSKELRSILTRYLAIQKEEARLGEEKAELQRRLAEHMTKGELAAWKPEVDGQRLQVSCRKTVDIRYDEETLRTRLGDRYERILSPDIKKIKTHLHELEPLLSNALMLIGSPEPTKVKEAVMNGVVTKAEFDGAFTRTEKFAVSVRRQSDPLALHEEPEEYGAGTGE